MAKLEIVVPPPAGRKRLSEQADCKPWVRADESQMPDCALYWLPVSGFPVRETEKAWISEFLKRLSAVLDQDHGLRGEIFFGYKQITEDLGDTFRAYAPKCMKLMGLGRFADTPVPSFPSQEEVQKLVADGKKIDFRDWLGDYLIWFIGRQPDRQRELFLGYGGMTTIYLPPDPKAQAPKLPFTPALRASLPVFQRLDVDGTIAGTFAMQDQFLEKSKALFGKGLESRPEYPGLAFILPLLESAQFFLASPELRAQWFSLFEVYVQESRKDKGFLLAFQKPEYEAALLGVLEEMTRDGLRYGDSR